MDAQRTTSATRAFPPDGSLLLLPNHSYALHRAHPPSENACAPSAALQAVSSCHSMWAGGVVVVIIFYRTLFILQARSSRILPSPMIMHASLRSV
ncbi:hypothetical protein PENSPDRAFT_653115 [Peniophora sp. CONT]|nr:hypothetical protein PENSPDRAFT_653115 [Peniophora sp. CONT]